MCAVLKANYIGIPIIISVDSRAVLSVLKFSCLSCNTSRSICLSSYNIELIRSSFSTDSLQHKVSKPIHHLGILAA